MLKVIIDTNIWISFLIGKSLKKLPQHLFNNEIIVIISVEQINELIDVLNRPKFHKYFSKGQVSDFLILLEEKSHLVEHNTVIDICRDPKDNYLLSMAIDSKANYFITGDNDLLSMHKIESTQIVNYKDFRNIFSI